MLNEIGRRPQGREGCLVTARALYRLLRLRLHRRLVIAARKRRRAFLAMPVTGKPSSWPKLNENHSVDRFRRESGQR